MTAAEDAPLIRAAVMGAAVGLSIAAAVIALAEHLLRRVGGGRPLAPRKRGW